ncbi:acyl-CoA dehydrogenase [Halioxenophilus aromaticivorans]|uniref:3-methylmercaptopropionyl-CoA dehydrogenase n=1 Tax=Halioxenophilus aromaticivorans TaxID=1306992 RepID=A0AAV3TZH4_9ALTE
MTIYRAPEKEFLFLLEHICNYSDIAQQPGFEDASLEMVAELLPEAAKFFEQEIAPSNHPSDQQGSHVENGTVTVPDVINALHPQLVESGWLTLASKTQYGGSGFPNLVGLTVNEMLQSSNVAYSLLSLLTQGVIHALDLYGSDEQKQTYLGNLVTGQWSGTMNLTEGNAGSDLGNVKTKAVRNGDHYLISGQKIYITWGDQELSENIIHLVLARTPDAPEGTKGISMFIVPKYLLDADGNPGQRNDVQTVSTEHKLGIHASPTCVMQYGDNGGAVGYLVGEENKGLMYMFAMMNQARLAVGHQGVAVAERAYQQALGYAKDRVQGSVDGKPAAIIAHPDVKRMLLTMRALTEASRALSFYAIACQDRGQQTLLDVTTPLVKAWCTEVAMESTSLGVQVHGGMGFVEETGAAQHLRDCRIFPIYEGTNGIQALDFIGRKCLRDGGSGVQQLLAEMQQLAGDCSQWPQLQTALSQCEDALAWVLSNPKASPAVAFDFMMLYASTLAGCLMATSHRKAKAVCDEHSGDSFYTRKTTTCAFYLANLLPRSHTYFTGVTASAELGGDELWLAE